MNNYIHPENQKILWNTINKVQSFSQLTNHQKEELFKSVISLFYEKYKHTKLNTDQLKQLNKDTISIIIQHLKSTNHASIYPNQSPPISSYSGFPDGPTTTHIINKETSALQGAQQPSFDNVFKSRLNEYEKMSAKPKPPVDLDFSEKLDDEPISETNMSSIIQKHLKERENEMTLAYLPATIVPPVAQSTVSQQLPMAPKAPIENNSEIGLLKQQMEDMRKEMKDEIQTIKELLLQMRNGKNNVKMDETQIDVNEKKEDKEIAKSSI